MEISLGLTSGAGLKKNMIFLMINLPFFIKFYYSILQMWAKHFFVLTDEKLFFTEQQDKEEEPEKEDEPEVGVVNESRDYPYCDHVIHVTIDTVDRAAL
jgi:hypothetical protein